MEQDDFVLSDARVVLADRVIENGWVAVAGGRIAEVGEGKAPGAAISLKGDTLIPGLIELHTDHLEIHVQPRPKVHWEPLAAVLSYDAQIAASGITTVYDCLRIGGERDNPDDAGQRAKATVSVLRAAGDAGYLRAEHHTHLRCEMCSPDVIVGTEGFIAEHPVALISLMDHTPGQRQFRDEEKLRTYYRGKTAMTEAELDAYFAERHRLHAEFAVTHRQKLVSIAKSHGIRLASHDDTTLQHVSESRTDRVAIAEFPTTVEAAEASHAAGIAVMMGAPNLVRGGSHSGNVAAEDLAQRGVLDIFSSDYVPSSLLIAAFQLVDRVPGTPLHEAIGTVTRKPAEAAGMSDRGVIEAGRRADLVRVHADKVPVVRTVWREGRRVI
ncbi:MAG: alpha-D-ribose 1-methylphosphonate 5-triphosphate diphosphatase [Hyphomicrobiaceae bacterium]|nr:alpha-D-ribose 1-methylphosphonate 5-triphosphate diphosphatase [Hyphomicrobiaceae bacterium]